MNDKVNKSSNEKRIKSKSVSFNTGHIDDTFVLYMKHKSSEFVINHNNTLDCKCMFCKAFHEAIIKVWDDYT